MSLYSNVSVHNETGRLRRVILGRADTVAGIPTPQEAYDPKSLEHILAGTYPEKEDMVAEMKAFEEILTAYGVEVLRPGALPGVNQIFTRDLGFVIRDKFVYSRMIPDRRPEQKAVRKILDSIPGNNKISLSENARIEGGDVIVHGKYLFVGTYEESDFDQIKTARTNLRAVEELKKHFPGIIIKTFPLNKSMKDARKNALHLDCCFQPVGEKYAVIHPGGFTREEDVRYLLDFFGAENVMLINADEMYEMYSNFFSIAPDVVVVEERQKRLIEQLNRWAIRVETVPYYEIGKQEGLLRCSTLPLLRE